MHWRTIRSWLQWYWAWPASSCYVPSLPTYFWGFAQKDLFRSFTCSGVVPARFASFEC